MNVFFDICHSLEGKREKKNNIFSQYRQFSILQTLRTVPSVRDKNNHTIQMDNRQMCLKHITCFVRNLFLLFDSFETLIFFLHYFLLRLWSIVC